MRVVRRRRYGAVLLLTVFSGLAVAGAAGGSAAGADDCSGVTRSGATTRIASPSGRPVVAYAVAPTNPSRLFVTDGRVIDRSLDGGCTWRTVYTAATIIAPQRTPLGSVVEVGDRIAQLVVAHSASPPRDVVYATLSPCRATATVSVVPGCGVVVSQNDGASWRSDWFVDAASLAMPPLAPLSIDALAVAPSDPNRVYLLVNTPTSVQLYASTDAARSWTLRSWNAASPPLAVDPLYPDQLWAGGEAGLLHSLNGGSTWIAAPGVSGKSIVLDVARRAGRAAVVTVAYTGGGVLQSSNGGTAWKPMKRAPAQVTSIAHGSQPGDLAVTTDPAGPSAGAPFVYSPARGWARIPGAFRQTAASAGQLTPEAFFFADPNSPPAILEYTPPFQPAAASGPNEFQGGAQLGNADGSPRSCYTGPSKNYAPSPPGPVTPAPLGQGPILVDNTDTGCLVSFDRYGRGRLVMQAPPYAEGVALTFDQQLIITTRFSGELTRTALPKPVFTVLDANIPNVEGPSFDQRGNLYVTDNQHNFIYKYPYPQYPGQPRELVWALGPTEFIEDTRIAPPRSPFAGDLFVEYHARRSSSTNNNPNAIAVFAPSGRGWRRLPDFAQLPAGFVSLGMAFLPDGSLLVPDFTGSGTVLRYPPTGGTPTTFATVGTNNGQYAFAKIDVTAAGYVYVSAIDVKGAGAAPNLDLKEGAPLQAGGALGTRNAIVRFDPAGNRMLPDFTENLSAPVGIAVPNVITGLPLQLPRLSRPAPPRGLLAAGAPPAPPPAQPVAGPAVGPAAVPAPLPAPAPGAAPAGQGQPQANPAGNAQPVPQPGLVIQQEPRVQVAVAQANRPNLEAQQDQAMTVLRTPAPSGDAADVVFLLAGSVVLLGCATRLNQLRQPQPVRADAVTMPRLRRNHFKGMR